MFSINDKVRRTHTYKAKFSGTPELQPEGTWMGMKVGDEDTVVYVAVDGKTVTLRQHGSGHHTACLEVIKDTPQVDMDVSRLHTLPYAGAPAPSYPAPTYAPNPKPGPVVTDPSKAAKDDGSKLRWGLLMGGAGLALKEIVKVLMFGANKYADNAWQGVPNGYQRYKDALYRHLHSIEHNGPKTKDAETGIYEWAHVGCNVLFLLWFVLTGKA